MGEQASCQLQGQEPSQPAPLSSLNSGATGSEASQLPDTQLSDGLDPVPAEDAAESGAQPSLQATDEATLERRALKKTEMNRKSQQRYRRRKKEMMQEQQRLNVELTHKCQQLATESETHQLSLEELLDQAQFFSAALAPQVQADTRSAGGLQGFADAMLELLQSLAPAHEPGVLRGLLSRATAQLAEGSGTGFAFLSKLLAERVARLIVALRTPNQPGAMGMLCSLMDTYMATLRRAGAADSKALLFHLSQAAAEGEEVPAANWPSVLGALQLTQGQVSQLMHAHSALTSQLAGLAATRASLGNVLSSLAPCADSGAQTVAAAQQGEMGLELLRANIAQERNFVVDFVLFALSVLDPVQHANGLLASFPYTPDMLALCALLAAPEQVGQADVPYQQATRKEPGVLAHSQMPHVGTDSFFSGQPSAHMPPTAATGLAGPLSQSMWRHNGP